MENGRWKMEEGKKQERRRVYPRMHTNWKTRMDTNFKKRERRI
jgi:hypothetical protein